MRTTEEQAEREDADYSNFWNHHYDDPNTNDSNYTDYFDDADFKDFCERIESEC